MANRSTKTKKSSSGTGSDDKDHEEDSGHGKDVAIEQTEGGNDEVFGWMMADTKTLLEKMLKIYPTHHISKSNFKAQLSRMNWENVSFEGHSATDCQNHWEKIFTLLRTYRTLPELLCEGLALLLTPSKFKKMTMMKDLPKKPMTVFISFYRSHLSKMRKEFPDKKVTELAQVASQRYSELSERKRSKYLKAYAESTTKYNQEMIEFKKQHSIFEEEDKLAPKKPRSPKDLFILHTIRELRSQDKSISEKYMRAQSVTQWQEMPDSYKLTWIKNSENDQIRYQAEFELYTATCLHPQTTKFTKSLLTKDDLRIKQEAEGIPKKPPSTGYNLFCSEKMKQLDDIPRSERFHECSKQWKNLSPKKKVKIRDRVMKLKASYALATAGCPELTLAEPPKKKQETEPGKAMVVDFVGEPKRPGNVYNVFCQERLPELIKEGVKNRECMGRVSKSWQSMTASDKEKYEKKHTKMMKSYDKQLKMFIETLSTSEKQRYLQQREPVIKRSGEVYMALPKKKPKRKRVDAEDQLVDNDFQTPKDVLSPPVAQLSPSKKAKRLNPVPSSTSPTKRKVSTSSSSSETDVNSDPPQPAAKSQKLNPVPAKKSSKKNRPLTTDTSDTLTSPPPSSLTSPPPSSADGMAKIKPLTQTKIIPLISKRTTVLVPQNSSPVPRPITGSAAKTSVKPRGRASPSSTSSGGSESSSETSSDDTSTDVEVPGQLRGNSLNKQRQEDVFSD